MATTPMSSCRRSRRWTFPSRHRSQLLCMRRSTGTTWAMRPSASRAWSTHSWISPAGGWAGRVDGAQVRLIPDVMVGVLELSRLLAGPEGSIAFATPAYPPFLLEPPPSRLIVREVPLQDDGALDLDALGGELDAGARVFVLVNPHNPTGRMLPRTELEQLAELRVEHGAWVIADEIHAPLVLGGATYTPWLEVSDAARACGFALTSASKAFNLAALKTALLVTASDLTRSTADQLPPLTDHAGLLGVIAGEVLSTSVMTGSTPC